jgi:hypothetical protein
MAAIEHRAESLRMKYKGLKTQLLGGFGSRYFACDLSRPLQSTPESFSEDDFFFTLPVANGSGPTWQLSSQIAKIGKFDFRLYMDLYMFGRIYEGSKCTSMSFFGAGWR